MKQITLIGASILGASGIALGAFAAHGLSGQLDKDMLEVFRTAARYQLFEAVYLLSLGTLMLREPHKRLNQAAVSGLLGTVIFSGSLYVLSLTGIKKVGMVTPIGGALLILSWLFLLSFFVRKIKK